jgi:hypothetical protein
MAARRRPHVSRPSFHRVTERQKRPDGSERLRIVFRSPHQPDVVLSACHGSSRFELADHPAPGDVILTTDPANRLLTLGGRRSSNHEITINGDGAVLPIPDTALWPNAQAWPVTRTTANG